MLTRTGVALLAVAGSGMMWMLACGSDTQDARTTSSSSSSTSAQGGGGGSGGAGSGGTGGSGGTSAVCADFDAVTLVVDELFLGSRDWNGSFSATAWQQFGFDIDGTTTQASNLTGHCQPNAGGPTSAFNDGNAGIDNGWGKSLVPIFQGLASDFEPSVSDAIVAGQGTTLLLKLDSLGAGADQQNVLAKLYDASVLGSPAQLDGSDCWPVAYESLGMPSDIESAITSFPSSSVTSNLWESGGVGDVTLQLGVAGGSLTLPISQVRISMQLDADHQGATMGLLGGVIHTETFISELQKLVGYFDVSLCSGATFNSLADQIRQASDIMSDGSQDPNSTCDGISIGIGFTAEAVRFGAVAAPVNPPANPCAP